MSCIFCRIVSGQIPSARLIETDEAFAFLDINPLSKGHTLVVPKYHAEVLHELGDEYLADILLLAKRVALAIGGQYNILQNNGPLAHQVVRHVHFHIIPKPDENTGLKMEWTSLNRSENLDQDLKDITTALNEKTSIENVVYDLF